MNIAVITDQISRDLDTACEQVASWGGKEVSLRAVGEGPIGANLAPGFLDQVCATLERWDLRVSSIAPQAFVVAMSNPALRYHRRILLPTSLHLAILLGARVVQIGAPLKPPGASGPAPDDVLEVLAEAAELAGNLGLVLGLENRTDTWADTGGSTAAMVRAVGHHALKITWDPAAALCSGEEPFPSGYQAVRPHLIGVRIADVRQQGDSFCPVLPGDGSAGIAELVRALAADQFGQGILLDPGLSPRLEGSRAAFETLQQQLLAARRALR